jgi:hypothetical protein
MTERDIYMAVMVASANGRGLHLTADEVDMLSLDDAISTAAANMLTEDEHNRWLAEGDTFWAAIRPTKRRDAAYLAGFHKNDPARLAGVTTPPARVR